MEHLTIIGSGTMGHSIVLNAAWAGLNVKMYGVDKKKWKRLILTFPEIKK